MPPFPHEKLPTETWSLSTFNAKAREMLQQSTVTDFVNLTLAGRWKDNTHGDDSGDEENSEEGDDGERRISIDPFTDCYSHNGLENVVITRDFDSLIGITNNLPLMCTLAVYPVPNFRDRLMKSNHLDHSVTVNVCTISVIFIRLLTQVSFRAQAGSFHCILFRMFASGKLASGQRQWCSFPSCISREIKIPYHKIICASYTTAVSDQLLTNCSQPQYLTGL